MGTQLNSTHATGIREEVLREIRDLAALNALSKVVLFGSRARGDFHRTSDIDLAVSGGDVGSFSVDVDEDTSTLLHIDCVNLDGPIASELRESIEREGVVVYEQGR